MDCTTKWPFNWRPWRPAPYVDDDDTKWMEEREAVSGERIIDRRTDGPRDRGSKVKEKTLSNMLFQCDRWIMNRSRTLPSSPRPSRLRHHLDGRVGLFQHEIRTNDRRWPWDSLDAVYEYSTCGIDMDRLLLIFHVPVAYVLQLLWWIAASSE